MTDALPQPGPKGIESFAARVLLVILLGALTLAAWRLINIAILVFGAVLIAIGLREISTVLTRWIKIAEPAGLAIAVMLFATTLAAVVLLFGSLIVAQTDELIRGVPEGFRIVTTKIQALPYGAYALEQAKGVGPSQLAGWAAQETAAIARSLARGVGYGVLIFLAAIYLAAQPGLYRALCLRLVPPAHRPRIDTLFDRAGKVLRKWLLAQLVVMTVIGTLSGLGLWALGIEAAFVLGLTGGILTFIPYIGAILAAVPATLVALTQGPWQALEVIGMYAAVHFVEGNFITPLVQAEATSLPPVLSLLSTVACSMLFGVSAVFLAAPLTLLLLVVVEVIYMEGMLGDTPDLPFSAALPTVEHPKDA
ncbi:AI-2E family transporter [uncultured Methylovirgula sp.]|uniref:AI-2E family transporter n=1 Tax=uncultured Methylovirgula sp. TaxID=1285960 RepID=UPI00261CF470|nr:AI-2E family transporter [uncultured Methylovirgula sp.]